MFETDLYAHKNHSPRCFFGRLFIYRVVFFEPPKLLIPKVSFGLLFRFVSGVVSMQRKGPNLKQ